jgi:hypothetical protein
MFVRPLVELSCARRPWLPPPNTAGDAELARISVNLVPLPGFDTFQLVPAISATGAAATVSFPVRHDLETIRENDDGLCLSRENNQCDRDKKSSHVRFSLGDLPIGKKENDKPMHRSFTTLRTKMQVG